MGEKEEGEEEEENSGHPVK